MMDGLVLYDGFGLEALPEDAPLGTYLLELRGRWRILWRVSDGAPPDGAEEPAEAWTLAEAA
jgi:hypothetical protein